MPHRPPLQDERYAWWVVILLHRRVLSVRLESVPVSGGRGASRVGAFACMRGSLVQTC